MINFGLIYGMSAFGLARQLGIERSAAQQYMDRYFARYPGVAEYMQRTREMAREQGYVETVFGRRLWLPEIRSGSAGAAAGRRARGDQRADAGHRRRSDQAGDDRACDAGSTGERLATKLIMQVHDELVLEVPDEELDRVKRDAAAADERRGGIVGAAGGGRRCGAELGQGALKVATGDG